MFKKNEAYFVENPAGSCRLCTEPNEKEELVSCDECERWFHLSCAHLSKLPTTEEQFLCVKCTETALGCRTMNSRLNQAAAEVARLKEQNKDRDTMFNIHMGSIDALVKSIAGMKSEPSAANLGSIEILVKRQALAGLPEFDGSPEKWSLFNNTFIKTTVEGQFSNLENLRRLQAALKGKANQLVTPLLTNADNVPEILKRLEKEFGRPELIYKMLLAEVTKCQKSDIVGISHVVENLVLNMDILGEEVYLNDHRLVDELLKKLPVRLQVKWTEEWIDKKSLPNIKVFSDWLKPKAEVWKRTMSNFEPSGRQIPKININFHNNKRAQFDGAQGEVSSTRMCLHCGQSHKIFQCRKFLSLSINQRFIALQDKACYCCLRPGHNMRQCSAGPFCTVEGCNRKTNPLLHEHKFSEH